MDTYRRFLRRLASSSRVEDASEHELKASPIAGAWRSR
jgi:hypothetical protein